MPGMRLACALCRHPMGTVCTCLTYGVTLACLLTPPPSAPLSSCSWELEWESAGPEEPAVKLLGPELSPLVALITFFSKGRQTKGYPHPRSSGNVDCSELSHSIVEFVRAFVQVQSLVALKPALCRQGHHYFCHHASHAPGFCGGLGLSPWLFFIDRGFLSPHNQ